MATMNRSSTCKPKFCKNKDSKVSIIPFCGMYIGRLESPGLAVVYIITSMNKVPEQSEESRFESDGFEEIC